MITELMVYDRKQFNRIIKGKKIYEVWIHTLDTSLLFPGDKLLIRCPVLCDEEGMPKTVCAVIDSIHAFMTLEDLFSGLNLPLEVFGYRKGTSQRHAVRHMKRSLKASGVCHGKIICVSATRFHLTGEDAVLMEREYIEEQKHGRDRVLFDLR